MPLGFHIDPDRSVVTPDGSEYVVLIRPGSVWPGWRWLDWVQDHVDVVEPTAAVLVLLLNLLALPSILARPLAYRLRRRQDWSVTVVPGLAPDYRPRRAVLHEVLPTKVEAVTRAEEVWGLIRAGSTPTAIGPPLGTAR